MAAAAIDILINATTDKASRNIKTLTGDIDDLEDKVSRTNKVMGGLGKGLKVGVAVAGVAAAAGIAAVGAAMGSAVRAGANAEAMMGKFNVVFGDTAGTAEKVTSELDTFARQAGRNKYMLREMASGFGDVLKPLGFSVEEAGGLSTSMTKLAIDLGSFNDMAPEQAFERLSSTLIGNHANALAFGVVINEAVLKEELAAMGADKLTGSLLEQAKVQARINLLVRGTTDAHDDAIRTSGEWNNQMIRLNGVLTELRTEIGIKLLPVLAPFLNMANEIVAAYGPRMADALIGWIEGIDQEKIKNDLDAFVKGLTQGQITIGDFSFTLIPYSNEWIDFSDDGGIKFKKERIFRQETTFGDWFSFKKTGNAEGTFYTQLGIGDFFEGEKLVIGGIIVSQKISFGDFYAHEWTEKDGFVYFKIGGLEIDSAETIDKISTIVSTAVKAGLILATGGVAAGAFLKVSLPTKEELGAWLSQIDEANKAAFAAMGSAALAAGTAMGGAFTTAVDAVMTATGTHIHNALSNVAMQFSEFSWSEHIDKLTEDGWGEFIADLIWRSFIPDNLVWRLFIPKDLPWKEFIDKIEWRDYLPPWLGGTGGGGEKTAATTRAGTDGTIGHATGTGFFRGGGTWVGETGPEFIVAPRGSQIFPAGPFSAMAAAGAGGPTINVNATVLNEMDAHVIARQVADIIRRGG